MAGAGVALVRVAASWDGGDVPLDPDGFVHLSTADQVPRTVGRYFAHLDEVVLLVLDEGALPAGALRFEDTTGHGTFPHLYAPLPAAAVLGAVRWRPGTPLDLR